MTPAKIYLLVLMLIPASAFAQLRGTYTTPHTGFGGTTIKFISFHKFLFHASGCLGAAIGEGNYTLKSDTLTLHFKIDTTNAYNIPNEIIATDTNSNIIRIEVSAYDNKTKEPIPLANIVLFDNKSNAILTDAKIDFNGHCILLYPKINDTVHLSIEDIGFTKFTYSLLPAKNYKMKFYFKTTYPPSPIIRNDIYKYIVINKKRKSFDLKYIGDDENPESFHKIKMKQSSWKHLMRHYTQQSPGKMPGLC